MSKRCQVELHTPSGFDAVRKTIEALPGMCTVVQVGDQFFVEGDFIPGHSSNIDFAVWAAVKQGYVKSKIGEVFEHSDGEAP